MFLITFSIKSDWFKRKNKVNFFKASWWSSFKTSYFKQFLVSNGCFGLFSKTRKGPRASSWCTISAWFFHENFLHLILYQWTEFQCYIFFSRDIKHKVLLSFYLDSWWHHKLILEPTDQTIADREKKTGRKRYKNWISQETKEFFRWDKKHFL